LFILYKYSFNNRISYFALKFLVDCLLYY